MDLNEIRKEIDEIDSGLIALFVRRMALSAKVADYKKENNLPIFVPEREQEILASVAKKAGPDMAGYAEELYALLFKLSRNYQIERNGEVI